MIRVRRTINDVISKGTRMIMSEESVDFSTAHPEVYRFPFPAYPNGWFPVALSHEIDVGTVKAVHRLGQDMVVYRAQSGSAHVVSAYCPHLGAHLGHGGTVQGEDLQCPFHHWRFGPDGRCTGAAGTKQIPRQGLTAYPCRERNGAIFVWHDAKGRDPWWEVPEIPEASSPDYRLVMGKVYEFPSHPQEAFENQPDTLHFRALHGWDDVGMRWDCDMKKHTVELEISIPRSVDDRDATRGIDKILTTSVGPSCNYTIVSGEVRGLAVLNFCPTRAGQVYNPVYFFVHRDVSNENAAVWAQGYLREYEKDVIVWETKRYISNPPLTNADGEIWKMRKWYEKWYS